MLALLEAAPAGVDRDEIVGRVERIEGVERVDCCHVWGLSADKIVCTMHLVVVKGYDEAVVKKDVAQILDGFFHTTIQTD